MGQLETSKQLKQLAEILNWSQDDIREFCASIEAVNRQMRETPTLMPRPESMHSTDDSASVNADITDILINLGIRRNIRGYRYLQIAIKMAFDDFEIIDAVTGKLYPSVAKKTGTTMDKVERSIRHAIETSRLDISPLKDKLFGCVIDVSSVKPTNKEFIATVADYLRQKHGKTY